MLNELPGNHWCNKYEDKRTLELEKQYIEYHLEIISRHIKDAHHPLSSSENGVQNEVFKKLLEILMHASYARFLLNSDSPESEWKTFRDVDGKYFRSVFTGQKSITLPRRWIDLE